ncbi:MAG: tetratricopeptide repeat protein [Planctomycetales bacterium]
MELNTRLAYFKGRRLWEGTSSKEAADSAILDLDWFGRELNFGDIDPKTDVLMKGVTAYRKDDFEEAIRLLRKAEPFIDREHRHLWHYAIGMSHIQFVLADGKFRVGEPHVQAGLEALTDAVTLVPDFGPAYSYLSFCYGLLQNDSMTLIASDSFVRTMPRCAAAYQSRGQAFQSLNDTRSAISDFRNSIRLNPMYDDPYSSLGLVYKSEKQMQKSIEMFKRAIAVTPPDNGFFLHHARLASVYQDVRDYELAIVHYQKALTLNPNESYELAIKESLAECEKLGRK